MKRYKEPEVKVIRYDLLEDIELEIHGTLSSWDGGDGEPFGLG